MGHVVLLLYSRSILPHYNQVSLAHVLNTPQPDTLIISYSTLLVGSFFLSGIEKGQTVGVCAIAQRKQEAPSQNQQS